MHEPVYAVAHIDVKDHEAYLAEYGLPVFEQFVQAGAEVLAATTEAQTMEGEALGNWTVIVKFPDADSASAWYGSAAYQPFKKMRIERLSNASTVMMVPGFDLNLMG
jgi:uncharacterized protein (DUF1330 family)